MEARIAKQVSSVATGTRFSNRRILNTGRDATL